NTAGEWEYFTPVTSDEFWKTSGTTTITNDVTIDATGKSVSLSSFAFDITSSAEGTVYGQIFTDGNGLNFLSDKDVYFGPVFSGNFLRSFNVATKSLNIGASSDGSNIEGLITTSTSGLHFESDIDISF